MSVDIVNLIESNPITKLNGNYQSKLIEKVKNNFTSYEQQLFLSSFYCFLKYDNKIDFVIDLDNVWKWVGYNQKVQAKILLENNFVEGNDYIKSLSQAGKQTTHTKGGQNKEIFMLNVVTFKKFCLKAGTKKADEIHDYYIKLEELIQTTINEECIELKLQLTQQNQLLENVEKEKEDLKEKTILILKIKIN